MADDISALENIFPVSRETEERLTTSVALLRKWQPAENLVSAKTLPEIWRRHVADSAQLARLFPQSKTWLDMGTGAGFPGLVIALCLQQTGSGHVHLVEANRRKCAFLRTAVRETGAPATVHEGRVADVLKNWSEPVDRVTARAVAPLGELFALAEPLMGRGVPAAFMKGQDFQSEIEAVSTSWRFDLVKHDSLVGEGGVILDIANLRRTGESA
jgi:16S rRNA (guanine527-N7)-methyltransferase